MNILDSFKIQDCLKETLSYHLSWREEIIYYYSPQVTFREIPDEISLTIPTLCYNHCSDDCNSKFCWIEKWTEKPCELTPEDLKCLIEKNSGITCVTIMTSCNFKRLASLFKFVKKNCSLKTALYLGYNLEDLLKYKDFCEFDFSLLDYIKVGPFKKEFGPLNSPNTNQRFYKINHLCEGKDEFCCINHKFLQKLL